jgi:uncharacterized protein involved in exopolysaccharide biosynthesis
MAERETVDLFAYFDLIRRRKWVILGCFLGAGIASAVVSFLVLPTVYRGTVKLMTKAVGESERVLPDTLSAYTALLQEDEVVSKVVQRARDEGVGRDLTASKLRRIGYLQEIEGVNHFELRVETGDPDVAASLANMWADQFVEKAGALAKRLAEEATGRVEEEIEVTQQKLTTAQRELNEFCAEHYVREPEAVLLGTSVRTLTLERERIESLAAEIEQYRTRARALSLLEKSVRSFLSGNEAYAASSEKAGPDDVLFLAGVHAQYTSLLADAGHRLNLEVLSGSGEISKPALFAAMGRTAARIATTIKLLEEEQNGLNNELGQLKKQLPADEAKLQQLSRAVNDAMSELTAANQRLSRIRESLVVPTTNPIVILSRAYVPTSPAAPRTAVNISVASAFGLVVGLGIAFLTEYVSLSASRAVSR